MVRVLILFLVSILSVAFAQHPSSYKPDPIDSTAPEGIKSKLQSALAVGRSSFDEADRKTRELVNKIYQNQYDQIERNFEKGIYFVNSTLVAEIQQQLNHVRKFNENVPDDLEVLVARDNSPNALNFGNGLIGFNLGLLAKLENRDQVLFVLCHEIAHSLADHSKSTIEELVRFNLDETTNDRLAKAKGRAYNKYTNVQRILQEVKTQHSKYSKAKEFEADSIGLLIYLKSFGSSMQALRCLELLDSIDFSFHDKPIDFRNIFDFVEFPFKESWTQYIKPATWHRSIESVYPDSIRTHPNCRERMAAMKRQMAGIQLDHMRDSVLSESLILKARFEQVASSFAIKEYGRSLYYALQLLRDYNDNRYLHAMVGKNLFFIFKSQERHELGKVLELPDPRFGESYDRYLSFLHKLRLSEIESLCYYYLATRPEEYFDDEEFAHSLWLCSSLKVSKLDSDKIASDYRERFPRGKYLNDLKP